MSLNKSKLLQGKTLIGETQNTLSVAFLTIALALMWNPYFFCIFFFICYPFFSLGDTWKRFFLFVFPLCFFLAALLASKDINFGTHNDLKTYLKILSFNKDNVFEFLAISASYTGSLEFGFHFLSYLISSIFVDERMSILLYITLALFVLCCTLRKFSGRYWLIGFFLVLANINFFVIYGSAIRQAMAISLFPLLLFFLVRGELIKPSLILVIMGSFHFSTFVFLPLLFFRKIKPNNLTLYFFGVTFFVFIQPVIAKYYEFFVGFLPDRYSGYVGSSNLILNGNFVFVFFVYFLFYLFALRLGSNWDRKIFNLSSFVLLIFVIFSSVLYDRFFPYILVMSAIHLICISKSFKQSILGYYIFLIFLFVVGGYFWSIFFSMGNVYFDGSGLSVIFYNVSDILSFYARRS